MTSLPHLVAFLKSVRFFSLLLCLAMVGGMQHLTAQAKSSAAPALAGSSTASVNANANAATGATAPHLRSTTMAQRKAAAAHAAIRRSATASSIAQQPQKAGVHANAIAGQPGGAALTRDTLYFSGTYPNYANSPLPNLADTVNCSAPNYCGIRKFMDALPSLPVAVPDTTTFPGSDYYEISLVQYSQKMHTDLLATPLRGYVQTNVASPLTPQYLGPLIVATSGRPVRLKFTNNLPLGTTPGPIGPTNGTLFIPEDKTVMGSGLGFAKSAGGSPYLDTRATIHLHGGNTPWISDGTPHQWTVPAGNFTDGSTLYKRGDSVSFVPDMYFLPNGAVVPQCSTTVTTNCSDPTGVTNATTLPAGATNDPGNGSLTFYYTNQQSARLLFYHDHAYGTTRLNVYIGEAAGYLITDQVEADMVSGTNTSGVFTAAGIAPQPVIPQVEIPLVIQDKTFVPPFPASSNIYSVPILENGSGYTAATVGFTGGCSVEPTATATVGLMTNPWGQFIDGAVLGITLLTNGSGCTSTPAVTITGNGTGAAAFASMATLQQQDPTWDTTNWGGQGSLWYPHVYMPNQFPDNPDGSAVNPMGRWDYASWFWPVFTGQYQVRGDLPCGPAGAWACPGTPSVLDPAPSNYLATAPGGPALHQGVGSIASLTPEAFMDTPMVNGMAYPVMTVDPKPYRFRILSVGNDRTLNLSWFLACGVGGYTPLASEVCPAPTVAGIAPGTEVAMVPSAPTAGFPVYWPTDGRDGGVPSPAAVGPSWIQIGTEGGVLPAPVVIPPAPINYEYNRRSVTVTNTSSHSLNLMPAERADVIVDFTPYLGKTLILYNDAPAPYPAFDSRYDYYTGDPDQSGMGGAPTTLAGFGPNTRTIMQVHVNSSVVGAATPAVNMANLNAVIPAAFKISQPIPVVPEPVYNKVYGGTYPAVYPHLADIQLKFTPLGGTVPVILPMRNKTIQELFELDYGRMNATLGTELALTNFNTQTTIPLGYVDPFTEDIYDSANVSALPVGSAGDGSQIWEVIHNGVDTHAIHFHLYNVQILDRVGWDGTVRAPDANEYGWKDTVRMNPLEIDFVALRPMSQTLPFPVPDSSRLLDVTLPAGVTDPNMSAFGPTNAAVPQTNVVANLGWEYVWHCHILGHEENDMMRDQTFQVPPQAPEMVSVTVNASGDLIKFTDKSLSETGFTVERATDAAFTVGVTDLNTAGQAGWNLPVTYQDTGATVGTLYYYRVRSFKPDADFYAGATLPNLVSPWSLNGHTILVPTAAVNPTSLAFGNQLIATTSAAQTITLTNTGLGTLTINGITLTGSTASYFVLNPASTCGASLVSNASCTISVKFAPVSIGAASANVAIASNDPNNPTLNVPLTGNGQKAITVTASSAIVVPGSPVPTITATAVGLVAPDTTANLTGMLCSTTYKTTSALGTFYPSTCSGSTNANYVVTYVAGRVVVATPPAITNPANGSTLAGPSQAFTWTASNPAAALYILYVGTTGAGSNNVGVKSGATSPTTITGLPVAGQTIYVRLYYTISGVSQFIDYTYKAFTSAPPVMTGPANGSKLTGTSQAFTWTGSNPAAALYILYVGTTGAGSNNVGVKSGATSPTTITGLPVAGQTIYVRLYYTISGVSQFVDYTYTAAGTAPLITGPVAPGGTLPHATAIFTWSPSIPAATTYSLYVGTTGVGSANIRFASNATSPVTVTGLPAAGTTVYVRINWVIGGVQYSADYTYIAG